MLFALIFGAALPIDGGMGEALQRQAQNAADSAVIGAARALNQVCTGIPEAGNSKPKTGRNIVWDIVTDAVQSNVSPGVTVVQPKPDYLDKFGNKSGSVQQLGDVPDTPGPCGVSVDVTLKRPLILAALWGIPNITVHASAAANVRPSLGVTALARYGIHTLIANGNSKFQVNGSLNIASLGCDVGPNRADSAKLRMPSRAACGNGYPIPSAGNTHRACLTTSTPYTHCAADTIDTYESGAGAPGSSNLDVRDYILAATPYPFDYCFYQYKDQVGQTEPRDASRGVLDDTYNTPPRTDTAECQRNINSPNGNAVYEDIHSKRAPDGLKWATVERPNPINPLDQLDNGARNLTSIQRCPGPSAGDWPTAITPGLSYTSGKDGLLHLRPGTYGFPVVIGAAAKPEANAFGGTGGNVVLDGCVINGTEYPGVYDFSKGVEICPKSGQTVSGTNVTLHSAGVFGKGLPFTAKVFGCPGVGRTTEYYPAVGPVQYLNDDQIVDAGFYGAGTYGITLGGPPGGVIQLSAPHSGAYAGVLLWQDNQDPGNIGINVYPGQRLPATRGPAPTPWTYQNRPDDKFDAGSQDGARVTLNGDVYNNSLPIGQQAKIACGSGSDGGRVQQGTPNGSGKPAPDDRQAAPNCDFGSGTPAPPGTPAPNCDFTPAIPATPATPTPCAEIPPQLLGYKDCAAAALAIPPDPTSVALCDRQLPASDLWRVLCAGVPSATAGRLQLGHSSCQVNALAAPKPPSPVVTDIYGSVVVDVFASGSNGNTTITPPTIPDVVLRS